MKKVYLLVIVLLIIIFAFMVNKPSNTNTDKPIVTIGAILPLTGRVADMGEGAKNATLMAIEEENNNPNNKFHYNVIFEDDQLTTSKTAIAANKLINIDKADAIISFFSNAGLFVSTLAEQYELLHFCNTWNADVARKGYYSFIHQTQTEEVIDVYSDYAKKIGAKKIAILTSTNSGAYIGAQHAKKKLTQKGIIISAFEKFNDGERFFNTIIEKAKSTNPDYYLITVLPPEFDLIIKQMKELGIDNEHITTTAFFDVSSNKELFNGSWEATVSTENKDFLNSYMKKYNKDLVYGTTFAYDIAKLIVAGYENTEVREGEVIPNNKDVVKKLKEIKTFNYSVGEINIDPDGVVRSKASIKEVIDGKIVPIEN